MAAPKGKYPRHHRFLPHDFEASESQNLIIRQQDGPYFDLGEDLISPKEEYLNLNKTSLNSSKDVLYGEIYILNAIGTTLFKIGISTNFNRRFRDLSAASPLPITVYKYAQCHNPNRIESHLHELFAGKHFKNEWFSLYAEDLVKIDEVFNQYFE